MIITESQNDNFSHDASGKLHKEEPKQFLTLSVLEREGWFVKEGLVIP